MIENQEHDKLIITTDMLKEKSINDYIHFAYTNKKVIEFQGIIFNETIKTENAYIIIVNNCHGKLILENTFNIYELKILKCQFTQCDISKSKIENLSICDKSKGVYNLKDNEIQQLAVTEGRGARLNNLLVIPIILSISQLANNVWAHVQWGIFVTLMSMVLTVIIIVKKGNENHMTKIFTLIFLILGIGFYFLINSKLGKNINEIVSIIYLMNIFIFSTLFINLTKEFILNIKNKELIKEEINIENNKISKLELYDNKSYMTKLFFTSGKNHINIRNNNVEEISLNHYDGYNKEDKLFLLLEKENIYIDDKSINDLNQNKLYQQFLELKNRNKNKEKIEEKYYKLFDNIFHAILKLHLPLFLRPKNILISLFAYTMASIILFNSDNMTIADTTTQVYLKTQALNNEAEKLYNMKGEKDTQINIPSFYPEYSAINYSMSLLIPLVETEPQKMYRANNIYTEINIFIYKIIALINASALLFIIGRNFLPSEKIKKEE